MSNIIDLIADDLTGQYRVALQAIVGLYAEVLNSPDPTIVRERRRFRAGLSSLNADFIERISPMIYTHTAAMRDMAVVELGLPESEEHRFSLDVHLVAGMDSLIDEIKAILLRDSATVERNLAKFAMQVELLAMGRQISRLAILRKEKEGLVGKVAFIQTDRSARRRASEAFFRIIVRQYLLLAFVESKLFMIAKNGRDLARVVFHDGTNGETFSITGTTGGYRSWSEVSVEIFHPNSNATVQAA